MMVFREQSNNLFTPLTIAISDTFLQMKAKPLIFLTVWIFLALFPQLLLNFAFQQPITKMVELSYQIFEARLNNLDFQITEQNSRVIMSGVGAMLTVLLTSVGLVVYIYSVLGDVVSKFRKKLLPRITQSLTEGRKQYVFLLKVVLASAGRILAIPMATAILGGAVGNLLKQPTLQYVSLIVALILFIINLLRYGLAPFVHLALGIVWRPALAASKNYYLTHRLVVSALFGFAVLLPLVVFSLLTNALLNLGVLTRAVGVVLGILQSILRFYMAGVLINFGMNNFIQSAAVAE
ncbi:hypothetical protein [Olavius algarvensis spirochete endosymbiont]|uniref:hypothetical protein n=1 Tax=Olavius algarvensis spirochete endosymbiont TaxID=260710 RepID=UPI000F519D52|nr:hypothetical protein [Olavius algarvensis spirochete endosymbiont]